MELKLVPTHSLLDEVRHGPKKKKKNVELESRKLEFPKLEFLVKNLGTQVSETRVSLFFLLKKKNLTY